MAKSYALALLAGPSLVAELIPEDVGNPSDRAACELAVNQCMRVLRRHGVTGAVVAATQEAVHRGAVIGDGEDLFVTLAAVPDSPIEMVRVCAEVKSVVNELRSIATAFRDALECCKVAWEEKQREQEH